MKPTTSPLTDPRGWRYEWPDIGLQMDVCPVGAGRDAVEADVTVRALNGEVWGHMVGPVSVVLDDLRSRSQLTRFLAGRGRRGIDWGGLVEQAFTLTQRAIKGGTVEARHTARASDLMRRVLTPPRAIVPGILTEGVWILGGRPKSGKSWAALGFGVALAAGGFALGSIAVEASDVLYLALEDSELRLQARLGRVLGEGTEAPERLHYVTEWPRMDVGGLDELRAWLGDHPDCRLVMIDTLARSRGRSNRQGGGRLYEEDYEALEGLADLARERHLCILVLHHLRKGGADDPVEALSGTMGLGGAADGIIELARRRGSADATLKIVGRDLPGDRELAIVWRDDCCQWFLLGDAEAHQLGMSKRAVMDALVDGDEALTPKEIADATELPYPSVRRLLNEMRRAGHVERTDRGKYRAPRELPAEYRKNGTQPDLSDHPDHRDHPDLSDLSTGKDRKDRPQGQGGDLFPEPISYWDDPKDRKDRGDHAIATSAPASGRTGPPCPDCGQATTPDGICRRCDVRVCAGDPSHATGSLLRNRCASCAMRGSG